MGQRTPLYEASNAAGAEFKDWHGWEVPSKYTTGAKEYLVAMNGAAVYDSSHLGRIKATGQDFLDLLNRLSTNEVLSLEPGQGSTTVLTTDKGRIIDLLTVLNLGDYVLLLTGPQTPDKVAQWIDKYTIIEDAALEDITATTAMLTVIGPKAAELLGGVTDTKLSKFEPFQSAPVVLNGVDAHVIRRDLVDLPMFELLVKADDAEKAWQAVAAAGAEPIGFETYEILRLEQASPGYDRELGEAYNPLESGLWGSISFTKGCYIGQEVIARLDTYKKVQKRLVSLSFSPDAIVETGDKLTQNGKEVGAVSSIAKVPTTGELIGLGYIRVGSSEVGTHLSISESDASATVRAHSLPHGSGEVEL